MGDAGAASYPFEVGWVPDGYRLSAIGIGTDEAEWDGEMGSDEPYTVLDVGGTTVIARVAPWEPMESELRWASSSGDRSPELFTLDDGRAAAFGEGQAAVPGSDVAAWNDLVVEVEPGVALVVAGAELPKQTLVQVAEAIDPAIDRTAAPVVGDAPEAWTVLGSVQADGAVALTAEVRPRTSSIPGPVSAHAIGYDRALRPDGDPGLTDTLAVMTLPAGSIDLEALQVEPPPGESIGAAAVDVEGRPGHVIDSYARFGGRIRSLVTHGDGGASIVVTASGGTLPDADELARVAASVRRVDGAAWEQAIVDAFGGPGLRPDEGEIAVATGSFGDVDWLLQSRTTEVPDGVPGLVPGKVVNVDECLKLSTRRRLCIPGGLSGSAGGIAVWNTASPGFDELRLPPFVVVTSNEPRAVTARLSSGAQSVDVQLHQVPGGSVGNVNAGLAVVDVPPGIIATCHPDPSELPEPPTGTSTGRIDLLDASGAAIGCIGI